MKLTTRLLALLLCLALVFCTTACGDSSSSGSYDRDDEDEQTTTSTSGDSSDPGNDPGTPPANVDLNVLEADDLSYVMVYNPNIYDEYQSYDSSSRNTGSFGTQVDVDAFRGDGLDEDPTTGVNPQAVDMSLPMDVVNLDGNRGEGLDPVYAEGDLHTFYHFPSYTTNSTMQSEFECVYEGEYCYIWTKDGDISAAEAAEYGNAFDTDVYERMEEMFGQPRFTSNGGKVNFLFYDMMNGLGGCFRNADAFTSYELSAADVERYGANLGHALLHINTLYLSYPDIISSTLAHELQHLIAFTNMIEADTTMHTWLNEGMSGYIEEVLYPGTKTDPTHGHVGDFLESNLIRHGQSLYNFETTNGDIGVYGSVYLFTEYLADKAGDDVFSKLHSHWRDNGGPSLSEASALYEIVPSSFRNKINNLTSFSDNAEFETEEEEWMSKLVLDFYLTLISTESDIPNAFRSVEGEDLLYDEINAADIEGGGRVILALADSTFEIPEDAEGGLVYIGLNSDFEVVTPIVSK